MQKKIEKITSLLTKCIDDRKAYQEIISFGASFTPFPKAKIKDDNLVQGCQSRLYLTHTFNDGKIKFFIHSDALISKGLAALISYIYSGEEPKTLFTNPPTLFKEIPILTKISLNRQLGISNLFKKMQLIASKYV